MASHAHTTPAPIARRRHARATAAAPTLDFAAAFASLTEHWQTLPDSDPLFDGGRRLLADLQHLGSAGA